MILECGCIIFNNKKLRVAQRSLSYSQLLFFGEGCEPGVLATFRQEYVG